MITAQGTEGSDYLASELSFVIQHGGLVDGGEQSTFGTVAPHSATGELDGLRGRATDARHGVLG